jgi:biotin carboxyl carrier protein
MAFSIEVDGEVFNVKVTFPEDTDTFSIVKDPVAKSRDKSQEIPPSVVLSTLTGMVVSVKVSVGQEVDKGDVLATIEAMKMIREVNAPHKGIIRKIWIEDGEMVKVDDRLMDVEMAHIKK